MDEKTSATDQAKDQARAGCGGIVPPPEHRWRPGQSGNPGGRPKRKPFSDLLRETLEANDGEHLRAIVNACIDDLRGDPKSRAGILGEVLNRVEGKVKDEIEHSGGLVTKILALRPEIVGARDSAAVSAQVPVGGSGDNEIAENVNGSGAGLPGIDPGAPVEAESLSLPERGPVEDE